VGGSKREQTGPRLGDADFKVDSPDNGGHEVSRPSWECAACGRPWPCDPAREAMMGSMSSVELNVYLAFCFGDAAEELPNDPLVELHRRFFSWAGPA
jgi:hypothetical protein